LEFAFLVAAVKKMLRPIINSECNYFFKCNVAISICHANSFFKNISSVFQDIGAQGNVMGCQTVETQDKLTEFDGAFYAVR